MYCLHVCSWLRPLLSWIWEAVVEAVTQNYFSILIFDGFLSLGFYHFPTLDEIATGRQQYCVVRIGSGHHWYAALSKMVLEVLNNRIETPTRPHSHRFVLHSIYPTSTFTIGNFLTPKKMVIVKISPALAFRPNDLGWLDFHMQTWPQYFRALKNVALMTCFQR